MNKQISFLELKNKSLENTISHENKFHKLINENKAHNECGVGRKSKFTDLEKGSIRCIESKGRLLKKLLKYLVVLLD